MAPAAHGGEIGLLAVRYKQPRKQRSRQLELPLVRAAIFQPEGATSENFRLASAVTAFGLSLRDSEYRGQASYQLAHELAESTLRGDYEGYRKELLKLIETARQLEGSYV